MRRTVPFVTVILGVAVAAAGCTTSPQRVSGSAAPAGVSASSAFGGNPSTEASRSTIPISSASARPIASASASVPTEPVLPVLGPDGLRSLKLGMSLKQALATGLITPSTSKAFQGCTSDYHLRGHSSAVVWFSQKLGLVAIDSYGQVGNTEGIHIGSSLAAVRRAYPGVLATEQEVQDFPAGHAKVPGNSQANYRIDILNNKVDQLTLQLNDQDCYE